ncbi:sigma-70 family RNA polymerase sigma factor [Shumkonia mesophila]|uniref:sigma-70 family RNA polymerase sigma factor n=1 Tax=Shumkonia mesophila TaxID=2838854 RepID=UPI002934C57C|nr:sigma-70 family RNA polymerase sigma factor [Shumkonia mesophila]
MKPETLPSSLPASGADCDLDDSILLERLKLDDAEAYSILVKRHLDYAFALALRMLRNPADAEDVAQESLVKAWTHRHSWQSGRAKFSTWLYQVVFNRCIDLERRPKEMCVDDVAEPKDGRPNAETSMHRRQVYDSLEDAIATIPVQQRAALTLSYYNGMGNGEIALVLGTSRQAVEGLVKRGRQKLRERLRHSEYDIRQIFADD